MDFTIPAPLAEPRASPEVSMTKPPQPSVPQSTSLDILQSIKALSKKFDAML
jgi:hypothetical protein